MARYDAPLRESSQRDGHVLAHAHDHALAVLSAYLLLIIIQIS